MDAFSDWLDEWILDLRSGRPGEKTITVYRRSVRQFIIFLAVADPRVADVSEVTRKHVRDWMLHLRDTVHMAANTRRVRLLAVRKFLRYVSKQPESGLSGNPADDIEMPAKEIPLVQVVSDEDLSRLLKTTASTEFYDRRDTAIIRLLLDTGVRRAELSGINVDDVDLHHQQVLVHGKGSKDRVVPFGDKTALALRRYLRARALRTGAKSPALFLSNSNDAHNEWRLAGSGVRGMLIKRCKQAGLGHLRPHQLRHTWAADLKGSGLPDRDLERLAGWSTPEMSRRYGAIVADEQARVASRRLSRGDRV